MNTNFTLRSMVSKMVLCSFVLLFTFCDTKEELVFDSSENLLTKEARVVQLLTEMALKNIEAKSALKSATTNPDCTGLRYPISFDAYYGDDPTPQEIVVNSDEELLEFFSTTLTPENPYYVLFPVTLLDSEGLETQVHNLDDLENIVHTALEVCYGDDDNDDSDGGDDSNNDDDNDGDDNDGDDNGGDDNDDNDDDDSNNTYQYCDKNKKKVYICHKGITICVSVNAIWGHLEHHDEDYLGKCD